MIFGMVPDMVYSVPGTIFNIDKSATLLQNVAQSYDEEKQFQLSLTASRWRWESGRVNWDE